MNYREFQKRFPTENAAIAYIFEKIIINITYIIAVVALTAGFTISIMTRDCFIAAIVNPNFQR